MTDTEYSAYPSSAYPSRDDLAARLRAHHDRLLSETGDMPKNSARTKLETTLKIYMNPFVEEADTAAEPAPFHRAAVTYLAMCRQHVLQAMPAERREPLAAELAELERLVLAYRQAEQGSAQSLVQAVHELTRCVDRSQTALIGQLEEIRCELGALNTTLQPVSSVAEGSEKFGRKLAHLDYVLTGSMALLVGPLPEPPKPPKQLEPPDSTVITTSTVAPAAARDREEPAHAH